MAAKQPAPVGAGGGGAAGERFLQLLQLVVFIDLFGVALVIPQMYGYAKAVGATKTEFGLLGSIYSAAQLVGSPFMGVVSDRYGRKAALQLNFAGAAFSYLCAAFAPSFLVLCLARVPVGIVKQTMMISSAYAAQLSGSAQRAKSIGRMKSMVTLAFMIGPMVGGTLATYDMKLPALLSAVLFLVDFLIVHFCLPHVDTASSADGAGPDRNAPPKAPFWSIFKACPAVRTVLAAILLVEVAQRLCRNSLAILLGDDLGLSPQTVGMAWGYCSTVATAVGAFGVPYVTARLGDHAAVKHGTLAGGIALAVWAAAPSLTAFFVAYTTYIAANFCVDTCLVSILTHEVHHHQVGAVLGVVDSATSLVGVGAPLAAGRLAEMGSSYPPAVAGACCLAAAGVARWLPERHGTNKPHED